MKFLSKDDTQKFLEERVNALEQIEEEVQLLKELEYIAASVSSASDLKVWLYDNQTGTLISKTLEQEIDLASGEKSLLFECYKLKLPFLVNRVEQHKLYHDAIDNKLEKPIKDMILYPIINTRDEFVGIFQAIITEGNFYQFIKDDLENLNDFSEFFFNAYNRFQTFSEDKDFSEADIENIIATRLKEVLESKKKLEDQIKQRDQYFAEIVHELRTPLNAILGFTELIQTDDMESDKIDYINSILNSGNSMLELINDILDSAKVQSGALMYHPEVFSLLDELDALSLLFASRMDKKNICFNTYIDPMLPKLIKNDKKKIRQILTNLIGNSIKFTPNGGSIDLDVVYNALQHSIDFSVKDTGIGIAKDKQKAIFEAFKQEDQTISSEFGGTGLGLNISKQFTMILGSQLKLESQKGKGARFYFTIDCKDDSDIDPNLKAFDLDKLSSKKVALLFTDQFKLPRELIERYFQRVDFTNYSSYASYSEIPKDVDTIITSIDNIKALNIIEVELNMVNVVVYRKELLDQLDFESENISLFTIPIRFKKLYNSILNIKGEFEEQGERVVHKLVAVVDDNTISAKYLKVVLEKLGAKVLLGKDGADAIELYKNNDLDMLFLDEFMQEMNGSQAIEKMKEIEEEESKVLPQIIGISGMSSEDELDKMRRIGYKEIMSKPFSPDTIAKYYYEK